MAALLITFLICVGFSLSISIISIQESSVKMSRFLVYFIAMCVVLISSQSYGLFAVLTLLHFCFYIDDKRMFDEYVNSHHIQKERALKVQIDRHIWLINTYNKEVDFVNKSYKTARNKLMVSTVNVYNHLFKIKLNHERAQRALEAYNEEREEKFEYPELLQLNPELVLRGWEDKADISKW